MYTDRRLRIFLTILVLLACCFGIYVSYQRAMIEQSNKTVELVMDYSDAVKISKFDGIPVSNVLKTLKGIGIQSIALPEDTLDTLEDRGELSWMPGSVILSAYRITNSANPLFLTLLRRKEIDSSKYYVVFKNSFILERVMYELKLALGDRKVKRINNRILEVSDDELDLAFLGVGVDPDIYDYLRKLDFKVIPRIKNSFRIGGNKISRKLNLQKIMNDDNVIIFDEESILGYPYSIHTTAEELRGRGIKFGFVEFSEQLGGRSLAKRLGKGILRVHSITEEEMEITPQKTALERWLRAVRERGVRLLYIRPYLFTFSGGSISSANVDYINKLKDMLKSAGFNIGYARDLKEMNVSLLDVLVLSFGVCAALLLLAGYFFRVPAELVVTLLAIVLFSVLFSNYLGLMVLLRKSLSLCAAVTFPSLAVISQFSKRALPEPKNRVVRAVFSVIKVAIITLSGGAIISGLLSSTIFMLAADQFSGVKLAFVLPMLIVAAYFFYIPEDDSRLTIKGIVGKTMEFMDIKINMFHIALGLFFLIFVAVVLLRSGNFGIPVPLFEREIRDILEKLFFVRPRTKEFLVGYPILILSRIFYPRIKEWLWFILVLGTVAAISLINTFCHIHSPIMISVIRSVNGLLFGIIIGLISAVFLSLAIKLYDHIVRA